MEPARCVTNNELPNQRDTLSVMISTEVNTHVDPEVKGKSVSHEYPMSDASCSTETDDYDVAIVL